MTRATLNLLTAVGMLAVGATAAVPALAEPDSVQMASAEPAATAGDGAVEEQKPLLVARIDVSDQRMYVYVDERLVNVFKVSTARRGYVTPTGRYRALWLSRFHRSRKYDWAPMPWSVFFNGGYAVHGTTDIKRLGRPASHGCVRLHPENAKIFYDLVKASGKENTIITVVR
jgi:lipoprotein-anchoring transpeptidase ErfK/SrfK